jgi:hypothetical protein
MVPLRHHNNVVADFEPLVKLLPPAPLRSTARGAKGVRCQVPGVWGKRTA